jgi:hypothetical protein
MFVIAARQPRNAALVIDTGIKVGPFARRAAGEAARGTIASCGTGGGMDN